MKIKGPKISFSTIAVALVIALGLLATVTIVKTSGSVREPAYADIDPFQPDVDFGK